MKFLYCALCLLVSSTTSIASDLPPAGNYYKTVIPQVAGGNIGPVGVGWLKLGIPIDEFSIGKDADGVVLLAHSLTPPERVPRNLNSGETHYTSKIKTPFSSEVLDAYFTFRTERLIGFSIQFGTGLDAVKILTDVKSAIANKNGNSFKSSEQLKEIECKYRNGASFKMMDGTNSYIWYQAVNESTFIESALYDRVIGMCANNLAKDDFVSLPRRASLVIRYVTRN